MSRAFAIASAFALCLAPVVGRADPSPRSGRWQLSIPVEIVWHTDPAYEVFRRRHAGGPGVMLSLDLTSLERRFVLGVDVGYRREDFSSTFANSLTASLSADWITAGVNARYAVTRFIEPYARVSGGAMHSHISIRGSDALDDDQWTPFGALGGGVMFRSAAIARGSGFGRLGFTFSLEGGYLVALSTNYTLAPPTPDDEQVAADRVTVRATRLGALDASGPYLRAVFGLRF